MEGDYIHVQMSPQLLDNESWIRVQFVNKGFIEPSLHTTKMGENRTQIVCQYGFGRFGLIFESSSEADWRLKILQARCSVLRKVYKHLTGLEIEVV